MAKPTLSEVNLNGIIYVPKTSSTQDKELEDLLAQIDKIQDSLVSLKARVVRIKQGG